MINKNENIINRKVMLIQAGLTVGSLAEKINLTGQTVGQAIMGKSKSYRTHVRIAAFFQRPMVEIWPELYAVVPDIEFVKGTVSHDSRINENVNQVN